MPLGWNRRISGRTVSRRRNPGRRNGPHHSRTLRRPFLACRNRRETRNAVHAGAPGKDPRRSPGLFGTAACQAHYRLLTREFSMASNPLALIAEITHRCPLHCVYCSNPLELTSRQEELATADWLRVFSEAGALGVLHLHLTGGEPLARPDLAELIAGARGLRLYTNLITSGIGLSRERLAQLEEAGLDHIQLSFQDSSEGHANWIAGAHAH